MAIWPDNLDLCRKLDPIAIRVMNEEEEIIARTMAARTPFHRHAQIGEMIAPITDGIPIICLIAMMIEVIFTRLEHCETVMFMI